MKQYATTSGLGPGIRTDTIDGCQRWFSPTDPKPPVGEGWTMCGACAVEDILCWFWVREEP